MTTLNCTLTKYKFKNNLIQVNLNLNKFDYSTVSVIFKLQIVILWILNCEKGEWQNYNPMDI